MTTGMSKSVNRELITNFLAWSHSLSILSKLTNQKLKLLLNNMAKRDTEG
jgi:hypothetical protein